MAELPIPTLVDVLDARRRIAPYLRPTALFAYDGLNRLVGTEVWVKHENHQPVGAFKVRGGVNLISQLSAEERARGVVAASTGNHGQSVAYAARLFGVRAIVCVPEGANPVKLAAMRGLGAEIVVHGRDFEYRPESSGRSEASRPRTARLSIQRDGRANPFAAARVSHQANLMEIDLSCRVETEAPGSRPGHAIPQGQFLQVPQHQPGAS